MTKFAYLELPVSEQGQLVEVTKGIYWLRLPLPFALDHINVWLLQGAEGWSLVDTGFSTREARSIWETRLADTVANGGLQRIVSTHFHPDHVGLAAWLQAQTGAEFHMTQGEFLLTQVAHAGGAMGDTQGIEQFFCRHGVDETFLGPLRELFALGNPYRRGVPEAPRSFLRLEAGQSIRLGDRQWRVIGGDGHSPEHASLYCDADRVLISGDMLLPKITTNVSVWHFEPDADPLARYLSSLEHLAGEIDDDAVILPSHGLPFTGAAERVAQLQLHHEERLDQVREACREPQTGKDICGVLFRRALDAHQIRFAMGEAVAHLNHLWLKGELRRELDGGGVYRFVLSA